MRPRAVDWGLALGIGAAFATGLWTLVAGRPERWWIFALHGAFGYLAALLLLPKLWRVRRRLLALRDWRSWAGLGATLLVLGMLLSAAGWVAGVGVRVLGYNLLSWHILLALLLICVVSAHMLLRARPLRQADLSDRRAALRAGWVAMGALLAWPLQQYAAGALGLPGRRFTGSREQASFTGNAFPTVSWMADRPAPVDPATWRLRVLGRVAHPLALGPADVDGADELTATLDCTGGFYSTQRWRGTRVGALLDQAGVQPGAGWVRFTSITGYRWSLPIAQAREALVATRVGDELLSHGHGAPARLVAPGERGLVWVKWLASIEVRAEPDPGQLLAINLSGL
jgi:DMSO/TMAO reductase YedYZ molybdopterin-dependent catalytic subunit